MKKIILFIVITICFACNNKNDSTHKTIYKQDINEKVLDLVIENCYNELIELPNIYDSIATVIPQDKVEKLILVEKLKSKGFRVTDWGHGNHPPLSPRIVSIKLNNGICECEVDKIYYKTISDSLYSMSERIKCKKDFKIDIFQYILKQKKSINPTSTTLGDPFYRSPSGVEGLYLNLISVSK